jgi:metal-sulfur cluster biosynthetic enzyme
VITREIVINKLKKVMDPELHINIVDLGLIYDVVVSNKEIRVVMTLTTPGCPLAPVIDKLIKRALGELRADKVSVELVWEPAWSVRRMSEEGKLQLGMI